MGDGRVDGAPNGTTGMVTMPPATRARTRSNNQGIAHMQLRAKLVMSKWTRLPALALVAVFCASPAQADQPTLPGVQTINLPYGFYNETFGFAAAYVYGVFGYPQPQAGLLGTVMAGSSGSVMAFGMAKDIRLPFSDRVFVDVILQAGDFKDARIFSDGNPDFPNDRAGSNESDPKDYIEGDGVDVFARLNFKYVLPIGEGRDEPIDYDRLDNGLPLQGAEDRNRVWNPLKSGRTYLELRPFYRSQDVDGDLVSATARTNGLELAVFYDNRDFTRSPSQGGSIRARVSRDWGLADSTTEYTVLGLEADQYFSLGATETFRQRVIALDVWTADSPTWNDSHLDNGTVVYHRPPAYAGATLGGIFRMRAFPASRFNDRAAVYYAAEARFIPAWNPFAKWDWLQKHVGVQWWQAVLFGEVGRVAPEWDLNELHSDMKWDAGAGIRLMAKGLVVRLDAAYSREDFGVQMMVSQPFQF